MIAVDSLSEIFVLIAPWLSAAFAIGTAAAAERAFRIATQAQPPERWRGEDAFHTGTDIKEEITERSRRNVLAIDAAATQSIATYLAGAAAIEAAAASQHGTVAVLATVFGIIFAAALSTRRLVSARRNMTYDVAWFVRMTWSIDRKWIHLSDSEAEDLQFAAEHPSEARALQRRR